MRDETPHGIRLASTRECALHCRAPLGVKPAARIDREQQINERIDAFRSEFRCEEQLGFATAEASGDLSLDSSDGFGMNSTLVIQMPHDRPERIGTHRLKHGNPADQGGSSGGAWIGKFDSGNNNDANYIISVESFGIDGQPGIDYGPYLNDDFKSLWDYGENGCQ